MSFLTFPSFFLVSKSSHSHAFVLSLSLSLSLVVAGVGQNERCYKSKHGQSEEYKCLIDTTDRYFLTELLELLDNFAFRFIDISFCLFIHQNCTKIKQLKMSFFCELSDLSVKICVKLVQVRVQKHSPTPHTLLLQD
jgi:hypothetical protein